MRTIGDDAKKLGVHLDSYILLGKLNYAMSNFTEALRSDMTLRLDHCDISISVSTITDFTSALSWTLWKRNNFPLAV